MNKALVAVFDNEATARAGLGALETLHGVIFRRPIDDLTNEKNALTGAPHA